MASLSLGHAALVSCSAVGKNPGPVWSISCTRDLFFPLLSFFRLSFHERFPSQTSVFIICIVYYMHVSISFLEPLPNLRRTAPKLASIHISFFIFYLFLTAAGSCSEMPQCSLSYLLLSSFSLWPFRSTKIMFQRSRERPVRRVDSLTTMWDP
jgi:hypothetical protein